MRDRSLLSGELKLAGRLDARFFALLDAVEQTGSLRKAARTAGYSYKGAWLVLDAAAHLAHVPLVETATGGATGGGTRLTPAGVVLAALWRTLQQGHEHFLREQEAWLLQQPEFARLLRRLAMRCTARNQFAGTITALALGPVTVQASLTTAAGVEISATVTATAAKKLKLKKGQEAIALVEASAVVIVTDFAGFKLSARNQLAGTVSRIDQGMVSSLVVLTLPGGSTVTATVTNEAVHALSLEIGQPATAVFKAYAVMLAVAG